MLKVLSSILCDLDPKVKVIGQKAGICDGVPSTSALVFVWFDSLRPINNLSVMEGRVFLGWTSTKLGLMFLHKDTTPVRLEPVAPLSRVKHFTTEPLHSNELI